MGCIVVYIHNLAGYPRTLEEMKKARKGNHFFAQKFELTKFTRKVLFQQLS